jgi:hypothetical protein
VISAIFIIAATVVVIYVFRPLFGDQEKIRSRKVGRKRQLLETRESLYDSIKELDFDYRMGKVEEDDYKATRSRYQSQAVDLMKAIDQSNGRAESSEDKIEQEIAALRGSGSKKRGKKKSCSNCNSPVPANARFCPQCGQAI